MKYLKYIICFLIISIFVVPVFYNFKSETIKVKEIDKLKNSKILSFYESYSNIKSNNSNINTKPSNSNKPVKNSNSNKVTKHLTINEKVNNTIKNMSLEEKIGQMLIISINSNYLTNDTKKIIQTYKPGGVILFDKNLSSIKQTRLFIQNLKKSSKIPLFISVDQEGGDVQRLAKISGTTKIPAMNKVGKFNDTDLTYKLGTVIALELKALGFNMDFAPVIDIPIDNKSFIYKRSFSSDPNIVSNLGIELAKGIESKKVLPVYKHFPGHGSTTTDSHYDLPVLNKTKEELYQTDLMPFQNAIKNNAKIIMVGHLAVPNIDGKIPASLSKKIITNLLKDELGYNGLVITDALNMGALTKNYNEKQIYEMTINAGVDILLMPKSSKSAIKYIKQSVKEGKITTKQINNSVKKILTLKYTNLDNSILSEKYIGSKTHKDIVNKIN